MTAVLLAAGVVSSYCVIEDSQGSHCADGSQTQTPDIDFKKHM